MTPYLQIRQKSKESKEIEPFGKGGNSRKSVDDRIGKVYRQRHHRFDRVSAGCRAHDWIGPKEAVDDSRFFILFTFPFSNVPDTHRHTEK